MSDEWALVNDQIFLGVLGSSVIPRRDIDKLCQSQASPKVEGSGAAAAFAQVAPDLL